MHFVLLNRISSDSAGDLVRVKGSIVVGTVRASVDFLTEPHAINFFHYFTPLSVKITSSI